MDDLEVEGGWYVARMPETHDEMWHRGDRLTVVSDTFLLYLQRTRVPSLTSIGALEKVFYCCLLILNLQTKYRRKSAIMW